MQSIVFKDRIKFEKRKNGYGSHPEPHTIAEKDVWACVCLPSMTSKTSALSAGISVDLTIHIFRNDFLSESYTHILYNGERYKIESATASINNLFVKLSVSRV